jgi:hypothetical protein
MNNIPVKAIFHQLKQDLIGKDAFRGITISYAWLANQFGHIGLGFIPAAILYAISVNKENESKGIWGPSFIILAIWVVFEIKNYMVSISVRKKDSIIKKKAREAFYDPRKWHFRSDLFTDLCFFALGALSARMLFTLDMYTVLGCLVIIPIVIYESFYWYPAKIFLQRALYPFQFRLSQWSKYMSETNKNSINQFMYAGYSGTHLLVFGEDDDEKIHLSIGIGSEVSYQLKKCRYLTAMKAFECFYRYEAEDSPTSDQFCWNWEEAELLIIDDINPSHSDIKEVIKPDEFLQKINDNYGEENRRLLREKKVIWMLGNEIHDNSEQKNWEELLVTIGVDRANIITINLSANKPAVPVKQP